MFEHLSNGCVVLVQEMKNERVGMISGMYVMRVRGWCTFGFVAFVL